MASRRPQKNQRKLEQKKRKRRERLKEKTQQGPSGSDRILINPAGREKMSEVIEEFVWPYLESAGKVDLEDYRKLIGIAVLAWNAAIAPADERQAMILDILSAGLRGASAADRAEFAAMVDDMIARKNAMFPTNNRYVLGFEVQDLGTQFHLTVISTLGGLP